MVIIGHLKPALPRQRAPVHDDKKVFCMLLAFSIIDEFATHVITNTPAPAHIPFVGFFLNRI